MKPIKFLFLVILAVLAICCKDKEVNNKACNSDNPLEEISWLKEIKDSFDLDMGPQRQQIIQYRYAGKDVFWVDNCFQCPDALVIVYDCEKNIVCEFGGIDGRNTCPDFEQNAKNKKILYDK